MSQFLNDMKIGESINVRGPFGKLKYLGDGNFEKLIKYKPKTTIKLKFDHLICLAGGSGITPFYQVIKIISNFYFSHSIDYSSH